VRKDAAIAGLQSVGCWVRGSRRGKSYPLFYPYSLQSFFG